MNTYIDYLLSYYFFTIVIPSYTISSSSYIYYDFPDIDYNRLLNSSFYDCSFKSYSFGITLPSKSSFIKSYISFIDSRSTSKSFLILLVLYDGLYSVFIYDILISVFVLSN